MDRRSFLVGSLGAVSSGLVGAGLATVGSQMIGKESKNGSSNSLEPFFGKHQSGISSAPQENATWISFNLLPNTKRSEIHRLMRLWTADASLMADAHPAMGDNEGTLASGETGLTITFGISHAGLLRIGREHMWQWPITELPVFSTDKLNEQWNGGDLVLQICGNDRVRVHHAARELVTDAKPFAVPKWIQSGFLPSHELQNNLTPRNLMGQRDGTANFSPDSEEFARTVWCDAGAFAFGTSMVIRRIRMNLDKWESLSPDLKSKVIGRDISTGAPLGSQEEFDQPDLEARDHHGLVIPADAHMRRARESKQKIHRRGYNYQSEQPDSSIESGLIFVSYQSSPEQFNEIQSRLSQLDSLNTWTTAIGSALFAVFPGCAEGSWIGEGIL